MAALCRGRLRIVALIGVVPVALAGCGGLSRTGNSSTSATDHSLTHCISTWDADTSSEARAVVKTAVISGHTHGLMFTFKGGECGLTVGGLGPTATYADIGDTGHFEPWINTSNGTPTASIIPVAEGLAREAESEPNISIVSEGSISALTGAHLTQISESVEIPRGLSFEPGEGPANSASYNIDAAAWNALSMQQKISMVSTYATRNSCPLEAVKQIALALRNGTFAIQNNSVSSTLAQACAYPASIGSSSGGTPTTSTPEGSTDAPSSTTATETTRTCAVEQSVQSFYDFPSIKDLAASKTSCQTASGVAMTMKNAGASQQPFPRGPFSLSIADGEQRFRCQYQDLHNAKYGYDEGVSATCYGPRGSVVTMHLGS